MHAALNTGLSGTGEVEREPRGAAALTGHKAESNLQHVGRKLLAFLL